MEDPDKHPYSVVTDYLQQGDIFRLELLAPHATTEKRIFRAADGRHGSVVFSHGMDGDVFEEQELRSLLQSTTRTPLHTDPFDTTNDGFDEYVIVEARLKSYFVIVSQTCDICGQDKIARLSAMILPIITIRDVCRTTTLPIDDESQDITIQNFLAKHVDITALKNTQDDFLYGAELRTLLANWKPKETALIEKRKRICNALEKSNEYVYVLPKSEVFRVPDCFIDFTVAHTVLTSQLVRFSGRRIARIADPYRDQFAQTFGHRISRVATPIPLKIESFKA